MLTPFEYLEPLLHRALHLLDLLHTPQRIWKDLREQELHQPLPTPMRPRALAFFADLQRDLYV